MQFTDAAEISAPRITRDGYMVVTAKVARTGIQDYNGRELGRPDLGTVHVYRPESAVFDNAAMASFAWRPVTVDHPGTLVDSKNWKQFSVGITGDSIARDGDYLTVPFTLMDQSAIDAVKSGKRALSMGYIAEIKFDSGMTPGGEPYDAIMGSLSGNHLAVVDTARAGASCVIVGDSWTTETPTPLSPTPAKDRIMADAQSLRTVTVDGLSISVTDQGAQMIERLQMQLRDALNNSTVLQSAHVTALATLRADTTAALAAKDSAMGVTKAEAIRAIEAKDGEFAALKSVSDGVLAAKDSQIATLKAEQPTAVQMDELLATRARVIDSAKLMLGVAFDPKGKTDAEIRRLAVTKTLGDAKMANQTDDFVSAAFDTLSVVHAGNQRTDPVRNALRNQQPQRTTDVSDGEAAYNKNLDFMQNAWRTPTKESV